MIVLQGDVANSSPRNKIRVLYQEMWLADFCMRSAKKLEVHQNLHIDTQGHKVVTLENVEVGCKAWYTIHTVSKADFYRYWKYSSSGRHSRLWQFGHIET